MPNSPNWSTASAPCRIELRGSPVTAAACVLLGLLAAVSLALSAMPPWLAWPAAVAAAVHGARLARRELARPPQILTLSPNAVASVDESPVHAVRVRWRGAIAFVEWRGPDGRRQRRAAMPDVLRSGARRELRLAWDAHAGARRDAAVAP